MLKKSVIICLVIVFAMGILSGCGQTASPSTTTATAAAVDSQKINETAKSDKKLVFGCTVQDIANPYFVELINGMKQKCEEIGATLTVIDGKSDTATQVSAMENFIAQKVDAIIVAPIDVVALEPEVKKAHDAKIPVINPCQLINGVDANINLVDKEYGMEGGKIAGQWIKDHLSGEAEVAILGYPEVRALIDRAAGLKEGVLSIAPNAKFVAEQSASNPETGMKAAETILQAHPNVKVIICTSDASGLGAMEAVKAAKKDSADFCIVGLDATAQALDAIRTGSIFRGTVDIQPFQTGVVTIDTTLKVIKDGPIKDMIKIPMKQVTAANIGDYKK